MKDLKEPSGEVDRVAHALIGAAIEVHRRLGPGLLESVYEHALALELEARRIPFQRQVAVPIHYRGVLIGEQRMDLLVEQLLVVELKSVESFTQLHFAQTLSYLRASTLELALLINFNVPMLKEGIRRVVLSR